MGRFRRPDLPGAAFHLTQRIQNRAHLLTPRLRWQIVHLLRRHARRSDARLLAYVVMSNHLHLVVVQGRQPLSRLMQPFLLSAALAIHEAHGTDGHAFERRYRDRLCRDVDHMRNAIAYTHANPVRAGLCRDPADYAWSSHREYLRARQTTRRPKLALAEGLRLFSDDGESSESGGCYARFVSNVLRTPAPADPPDTKSRSSTSSGLSGAKTAPAADTRARRSTLLQQLAANVVAREAPNTPVVRVCSRWGRRSLVSVRAAIAREAHRAGFRGYEIAEFLQLSPSSISRLINGPDAR